MLISFHLAHPSAGAIGASLVVKAAVVMQNDAAKCPAQSARNRNMVISLRLLIAR